MTTDMWSDPDLKPYMAITAHWIEQVQQKSGQKKLHLRADLIGFMHAPGSHTGERLAQVFYFIISRMRLTKKVMSYLINWVLLTFSFIDWLGDNRQCVQQYHHDACLRRSDKNSEPQF